MSTPALVGHEDAAAHLMTPLRRVLIVHNAYQLRGGEDSVVDAELELLRGGFSAAQR